MRLQVAQEEGDLLRETFVGAQHGGFPKSGPSGVPFQADIGGYIGFKVLAFPHDRPFRGVSLQVMDYR